MRKKDEKRRRRGQVYELRHKAAESAAAVAAVEHRLAERPHNVGAAWISPRMMYAALELLASATAVVASVATAIVDAATAVVANRQSSFVAALVLCLEARAD